MSCGASHRGGLDPLLLWLWRRLAAVAPIQPLAWELPYAMGAALKKPIIIIIIIIIINRNKMPTLQNCLLKIKDVNFLEHRKLFISCYWGSSLHGLAVNEPD